MKKYLNSKQWTVLLQERLIQLEAILIQKKWFREWFPKYYFVKVNGTWSMYSEIAVQKVTFVKEQNIEDVTGPGIRNWIYCQNDDCNSIINFKGPFAERKTRGHWVWDYTCSCCGTEQHYIPDMAPIPCDEKGIPLRTLSVV